MVNKDSYIALLVNGIGYAEVPSDGTVTFGANNLFSIEAWLKLVDLNSYFTVFKKQGVVEFSVKKGAMSLRLGNITASQDLGETQISQDMWNHLFVTYSNGRVDFYLNGIHCGMTGIRATVTDTQSAFVVAENGEGKIRSVRLYNQALEPQEIMDVMYGPKKASCVMDLDFTQNPPRDNKRTAKAIALIGTARMSISYPSLLLSESSYVRPTYTDKINPGGQMLDCYTIQTTISVNSVQDKIQTIYCNGQMENQSGISLYLTYDTAKDGFYIYALRGSITQPDNILKSASVVKADDWVNIAVRFNGVEHAIFIDGVKDVSKDVGPIPTYLQTGSLMIGACMESGQLTGAKVFSGYMSFLSVWSLALPDLDITRYITEQEDSETPGLVAEFDFCTFPARNTVNHEPITLLDIAFLTEKTEALTRPTNEIPMFCCEKGQNTLSISPEQLAKFRTEAQVERLKAQMKQMATNEQSNADCPPLPFFHVSRHQVDGDDVFVVHLDDESYVAYCGKTGLSECTLWRVQLIFIVVGGIMMALTGMKLSLSDKSISIIVSKILTLPSVQVALAVGTAISATDIFDIFKKIYQAGVIKELILSMLSNILFWAVIAILSSILQLITGSKLAAVLVALAGTVILFAATYLQRPSDCDPPKSLVLSEITFCDNTRTRSIPLRKNADFSITTPEWTQMRKVLPDICPIGDFLPTHSLPAAYTREQLEGRRIPISVKVISDDTEIVNKRLRARVSDLRGVFGIINEFEAFPGFAVTAYLTVTDYLVEMAWSGVERNRFYIYWEYLEDMVWVPLETTEHVIYMLVDTPHLPWNPYEDNDKKPWTDALDLACGWAAGMQNADSAAGAITHALHTDPLGPQHLNLNYDSRGHYKFNSSTFALGKFIQAMVEGNSGEHHPELVNCETCASAVMIFSNLVGCNLAVMKLTCDNADREFHYNFVKTISNLMNPVWESDAFKYHEIAYKRLDETRLDLCPVYDACLKLNASSDPWKIAAEADDYAILPGFVPMSYSTINDPIQFAPPYDHLDSYIMRLLRNSHERPTMRLTPMERNFGNGRFRLMPNIHYGRFVLVTRGAEPSQAGDIIYTLTEQYTMPDALGVSLNLHVSKCVSAAAAAAVTNKSEEAGRGCQGNRLHKDSGDSCSIYHRTSGNFSIEITCYGMPPNQSEEDLFSEVISAAEKAW